MAVILEKKNTSGVSKKYILMGAGRTPGNFGTPQEPYVVVCDKEGTISCHVDFADSIKVVSVDGKTPAEMCN